MKQLLSLFFIVFTISVAYSQLSIPGTPPSFNATFNSDIPLTQMPSFDLKKVLAEDALRQKSATKPTPGRFGHKMPVTLNLNNSGKWETLPNGDRIWRLAIQSKKAFSINLLFDKFYLPHGGELYLYNEAQDYVLGAFTSQNNKPYNEFSTSPTPGDMTILEYYEPQSVKGQAQIQISQVVHAYKDIFKTMQQVLDKGYGDSGACNIDVECPLGNNWANEIKSVALILVNGNDWCSGAMVNNTLQDGTPYFLTADHCLSPNLTTWTFVFNYESPSCGGANGSYADAISGATLKANSGASDFALLELSATPPPSYTVYYAGWDNSGVAPNECTAIHHPSGDVKKISFNDDPLINGVSNGVNYWRITEWEQGTTEGGSSGSPIFDANHRIVGQLQGGLASCSNITWDEYGKFSVSWDMNTPTNQQLKHWLDPNNSGAITQDGAFFLNIPSYDIALQTVISPPTTNALCDTVVHPSFKVKNLGDSTITHFDVVYEFNNNGMLDTFTWMGSIALFQETTVNLPPATLPYGIHSMTAFVTMPNDSLDANLSNDTLSFTFNLLNNNGATVNFTTDNDPDENTYEIIDENGNILFMRDIFNGASLNTESFCLNDGCYRFVINDSDGDGLGPNGQFEVVIDGISIGLISGTFTSDTLYACLPYTLYSNFKIENQSCITDSIRPLNTSQLAASYNWSMPGASPNTSTSANPVFIYNTPGTYAVMLTVLDANGIADDTTITISVIDGNSVTVSLLTDTYPEETSWRVVDANGNTVFSVDNLTDSETMLTEILCLDDGCYDFIIEDSYGDGLSGFFSPPGTFTVDYGSINFGSITGNFGSSFTISGCVSKAPFANFELKNNYCIGEDVTPTNHSLNAVSYSWTLPNSTIGTSTAATPTFSYIASGSYPITLTITDANGMTDDTTYMVTVTDGRLLTIDLLTDNYPTETRYEITDSVGNVVFIGDGFTGQATLYTEILCLPIGCYTFTIYDSAGDGICCGQFGNGNYTLIGPDTTQLTTGGQFGNSESFNFCITPTTSTEAISQLASSVVVFPNPTNGKLYFETKELPQQIQVVDLMGRVLKNITTPAGNFITLNDLATGVYVVQFRFDDGVVSKKIVKQ